jgi:flavin reductase (DIM6/NTAB) family NADH-FMN oxidoreductase RutF
LSGQAAAERPFSRTAFLDAMAELPAGVVVVTARHEDGRPLGATVSAVASLSLEPPLVLVCLARASETCGALRAGAEFLVHVLREGQEHIARALARKGPEKFRDFRWNATRNGLPEIPRCAVTVSCVVEQLLPGGDHLIVVGAVTGISAGAGTPLLYHRRRITAAPTEGHLQGG